MDFTIKINNEIVEIDLLNSDLSILETKDRTLDNARFIIPTSTRKQVYDMLDNVEIVISDGVNTYENDNLIVESDNVTPVNSKQTIFKHEITVIERTKKLEYYTIGNRNFKQLQNGVKKSCWDIIENLRVTVPFELDINVDTTRIFEIHSSLDFMKNIEAPEFTFKGKTLREAIDEVMDYCGGVARLIPKFGYPYNILVIDMFNEVKDLENKDNDTVHFQNLQNINEYATKIDMEASNQIGDSIIGGAVYEPNFTEFKGLISDDGAFLESNTYLEANHPKYRKIRAQMRVPTVSKGTVIIDITDNIVEREVYDTLPYTGYNYPIDESGNSNIEVLYQSNCLIWNYNETQITNMFTEIMPRGGIQKVPVIELVIKSGLARKYNPQIAIDEYITNDDSAYRYDNLEFNIAYVPIFDSRSQLERIDGVTSGIYKNSTKIANQSDNIIAVGQTLDKMFTTLQQIGNAEYITQTRDTDLSKIYDIGDYTQDGYILTKRELIFFRNEYTVNYEWTKNYQKVNGRIRIDSMVRLFEIPSGEQVIKRNEYYSEYLIASFNNLTDDSDIMNSAVVTTFTNTFKPLSTYDTPILAVAYESLDVAGLVQNFKSIVKPVISYGGGNSLNFYFDFRSPNVAGTQVVEIDGDKVLQAIEYTDSNGEVDLFKINFLTDYTVADKHQLPIVPNSDLGTPLIESSSFKLLKNLGESFAMTFAIHVIPEQNYEDEIIIGDRLIKRNNLIEKNASIGLNVKLISGSGRYNRFENKKGKSTHTEIVNGFDVYGDHITIETPTNDDSWAIVDNDNNLLLAVNQLKKDGTFTQRNYVYFNRKHKRGDIIDLY